MFTGKAQTMDIKHLQYIITVADEGNITKAAEKLFISQSSLSYYLTTVEKQLGTPLFLRQRHGVTITPAGEKYVEACREVVAIRNKLYDEIAELKKAERITICSSSVWGSRFMAEYLPIFEKKYPGVHFEVSQVESIYMKPDIQAGRIAFALMSVSPYEKTEKSMELLRKEPFYFAVNSAHSFVKEHSEDEISLKDVFDNFSDSNFLISRKQSANYITIMHVFEENGFMPASFTEVNGLYLTADMVASGIGVNFMPESGIINNPNLKFYRVSPKIYRYNMLYSKPISNQSEIEAAFHRFILSSFRDKK